MVAWYCSMTHFNFHVCILHRFEILWKLKERHKILEANVISRRPRRVLELNMTSHHRPQATVRQTDRRQETFGCLSNVWLAPKHHLSCFLLPSLVNPTTWPRTVVGLAYAAFHRTQTVETKEMIQLTGTDFTNGFWDGSGTSGYLSPPSQETRNSAFKILSIDLTGKHA